MIAPTTSLEPNGLRNIAFARGSARMWLSAIAATNLLWVAFRNAAQNIPKWVETKKQTVNNTFVCCAGDFSYGRPSLRFLRCPLKLLASIRGQTLEDITKKKTLFVDEHIAIFTQIHKHYVNVTSKLT